MPASTRMVEVFRFSIFELDVRAGELRRAGVKVKLQEQPLQVLGMLLERAGEVVTRAELRERLWPSEVFVDFDHSLNSAVQRLREALGDSAETPRFIETIPRRGYRFIAPVTEATAEPLATAAEAPPVDAEGKPRSAAKTSRWQAVLVALVLLALLIYAYQRFTRPRWMPQGGRIIVAVLPFENLSGDPSQDYFGQGIAEEIVNRLGRLAPGRIGVVARTSTAQYLHSNRPIAQIGNELGAGYVVVGSVRRNDTRVRISAALVQVRDQTQVWSATFDRDLKDILATQDDVARAVAQQIDGRLVWRGGSAGGGPRVDAYLALLEGRFRLYQRPAEAVRTGLARLEEATVISPDFAAGWAAQAAGYAYAAYWGYLPPNDVLARARVAADRAIQLDPRLPDAHDAMAQVLCMADWDWKGCEHELLAANEIDPSSEHDRLADLYARLGRWEDVEREEVLLRQLDPFSNSLGWRAYLRRRYPEAIAQFRLVLQRWPDRDLAHYDLGLAYLAAGEPSAALHPLQRALELSPEEPRYVSALGYYYGVTGNQAEARKQLDRLAALARDRYVSPLDHALIYTGMGDRERAIEWLTKAADEHTGLLMYIAIDPRLDPLRGDARFAALMQRMHLPAAASTSAVPGTSAALPPSTNN